jgi:membrane fusion protein, copper/silver efflux system
LRLYGKVQADERLIQSQVSYFPGRIEKLFVNFTGEVIHKGQPLATVYSPDLVTAQQELIETAATKTSQPALYEASKEKLRQWKLTDNQISSIENTGKVQTKMDIISPAGGIVTSRLVNNGDYVSQGTVLYQVSDLSSVWVLFDAYESDLPFLNKGDKIEFNIQAIPGSTVTGIINFIDPVLDPVTRVAKVRVEVNNSSGKLKPEMFATGIVKSKLERYSNMLVIPKSSVLWTGKRSLVYVKQKGEDPIFHVREIGLGPLLGNSYIVTDGLSEGEEIVTEGAFSVDAAAQLEGKPSMMNHEMSAGGVSEPGKQVQNITFKVSGNCEMCKERIEKVTKSVAGVVSAYWNAAIKMLSVSFHADSTNKEKIEHAVADSGHDTDLFKASDLAYNKLPECCKYDRTK